MRKKCVIKLQLSRCYLLRGYTTQVFHHAYKRTTYYHPPITLRDLRNDSARTNYLPFLSNLEIYLYKDYDLDIYMIYPFHISPFLKTDLHYCCHKHKLFIGALALICIERKTNIILYFFFKLSILCILA